MQMLTGGALLLACGAKGKRFALPHARVMIHQPWGGVSGQAADIGIQAREIIRIKRLIIELEMRKFAVFLVHLSLKYRHRHLQLRRLYDLIEATEKPVIVAGDFNTFWGEDELYLFMEASGMRSANVEKLPSYPSQSPRKELDFILYGSGVEIVDFQIPRVCYSDHLPLVCDFRISGCEERAA